jgi:glucokinase
VAAEIEKSQALGCTPVGVGLGIPGLQDSLKGLSYSAANLDPAWKQIKVTAQVEQRFGLPAEMDNDVRCHALGEKLYGAGRGVENLILITLGTGIGAGIFLNGKMFYGAGGCGGEVGHVTIMEDGPLCSCGNHGCVEALCGAPGISRRAREEIAAGVQSKILALAGGDLNAVTPKLIYEAALAGDPLAEKVMAQTGNYLGIAMAGVVNIINPELLIIGGGVAGAGEMLIGKVRETIKKRAMAQQAALVKVVSAELGEDAGLIGAAMLLPVRGRIDSQRMEQNLR